MTDTTKGNLVTGSESSDAQIPAGELDIVPVRPPSTSHDGQMVNVGFKDGPINATSFSQQREVSTEGTVEAAMEERERRRKGDDVAETQKSVNTNVDNTQNDKATEVNPLGIKMDDTLTCSQESNERIEGHFMSVSEGASEVTDSSYTGTPKMQRKRTADTIPTVLKKNKIKTRKVDSATTYISTRSHTKKNIHDNKDFSTSNTLGQKREKIVRRTKPAIHDNPEEENIPTDVVEIHMISGTSEESSAPSEARVTRKAARLKNKQDTTCKSPHEERTKKVEDTSNLIFDQEVSKDAAPLSAMERGALERVEASELGETVLEWARELEVLRSKCSNIHGRINAHMKRNIARIQEGVSMLVSRVMITGDPSFLRMRHREMTIRIKELERENCRLEDRVRRMTPPGMNSPPRRQKACKVLEKEKEREIVHVPCTEDVSRGKADTVVWQASLPQRVLRSKDTYSKSRLLADNAALDKERALTKQIERLVAERKALREDRRRESEIREREHLVTTADTDSEIMTFCQQEGSKPRIIEDRIIKEKIVVQS